MNFIIVLHNHYGTNILNIYKPVKLEKFMMIMVEHNLSKRIEIEIDIYIYI